MKLHPGVGKYKTILWKLVRRPPKGFVISGRYVKEVAKSSAITLAYPTI